MPRTLYVSFVNAADSGKAAGALLDYGARKEDLSVVAHYPNPSVEQLEAYEVGALAGQRYAGRLQTVQAMNSGSGRTVLVEARDELDEDDDDSLLNDPEPERAAKSGITTTTAADAGLGAAMGASIGLGIGVLAGLAALIVPGVGLVFGAGALASAIAAAAATTAAGAVAGGVTGYLKDQGVPDDQVHEYTSHLERGGAMLSLVVPSGEVDEMTARHVLSKYGAISIDSYGGEF